MGSKRYVSSSKRNSLNIDQAVYKQLLRKLNDADSTQQEVNPNRVYTRLEYHEPFLDIELETGDRNRTSITVATRNISRGGISVLHSAFAYPGSNATLLLNTIDDKSTRVRAELIRCQHVGGVVHELGLRFKSPIQLHSYILPEITDAVRTHERVNPESLKAAVLVVGNDDVHIPFIQQYLRQTFIDTTVLEPAQITPAVPIDSYDLIICNLDAPDQGALELIETLREREYLKPIIALGSSRDAVLMQRVRLSSADAYIDSPVDQQDLLRALADYLLTPWNTSTLQSVRDQRAKKNSSAIRTQISKLGQMIEAHTNNNDAIKLYAACARLRSIAPLAGLPELGDKANTVGERIAEHGDIAAHHETIGEIRALCASA